MTSEREHAFETFYTTYARATYWVGVALCHDPEMAEDAVQEVFIKLWEEQVDPSTIQTPHVYLATRVKNRLYDVLRHRQVMEQHTSRIRYEIESESLEDLSEEEIDEHLRKAWALVNSLPESAREIFLMASVEGLKYSEIAARRGISVNTVKTQLRLARKRLRGDRPTLSGLLLLLLSQIS